MEIKAYVKSLTEYVPSVLLYTLYGVIVGAVGGLFGYVTQLLNITEVEPWQWSALFVAAMIVAQFIVFHKTRMDRDLHAPDKLTWNWTMHQVHDYLIFESSHSNRLEGTPGWGLIYLHRLRQAARNGEIVVWGKMAKSTGVFNSTIDPIKRDYWQTYQFDLEACLKPDGDHSRTQATFQDGTEIYDNLKFNSRQIRKLWKPKSAWARLKKWLAHKIYPCLTA